MDIIAFGRDKGELDSNASWRSMSGVGLSSRLALGVIAAVWCCVCAPTAVGAVPAGCPGGVEPYSAAPAVREACGIHLHQRRSTAKLPYGGTEYNYEEPNGGTVSLTVPPASFDAAKASPSELETFGIPPEPPAGSAEYPLWKGMIEKGIHFLAPPPALAQVRRPGLQSTKDNAPLDGNPAPNLLATTGGSGARWSESLNENWSGYLTWNGKGSYTQESTYFIEPSNKGDTCSPVGSAIWGGLGGNYEGAPLGQDGTEQGSSPIQEHLGWFEVLPSGLEAAMPEIHATPGHYFLAAVQYHGSEEYSFYEYNYNKGETARGIAHGRFDGNVADFIVERLGTDGMVNVGSVTMQGFINGTAFASSGRKTQREVMVNTKLEINAQPGAITNHYEFHNKYERCPGSSPKKGKAEEEGAPPVATTAAASAVAGSTATLNGTINPEGHDTTYTFEYGTEAENYSSSTPEQDAGAGTSSMAVSASVTGLQPGTTYHYRVIATSGTGIVAGEDKTFATTGKPPSPPPTVTTEGASGVGTQTATLNGTVNPNGLDAHYYFEYGTNRTLFESFAPSPPGNDAGSGSTAVKVSTGLTGLVQCTTYFDRSVANNSTGTGDGAEKEFTTLFSPPVYFSQFGKEGSGNGEFKKPVFVAIDANGNAWVSDRNNYRVEEFSESGNFVGAIGSLGTGNGQFIEPSGVAINESAADIYVADKAMNKIEEFSTGGTFIRTFGSSNLVGPTGVAIDASGDVWVSNDLGNIKKFSATGALIASYGGEGHGNGEFKRPQGIAINTSTHAYIADGANNRVQELSSEGAYLGQFGAKGAGNGQFEDPYGVAIDPRSGNIFVVDEENDRVEVFTPVGTFLGQFGSDGSGNGVFIEPKGIAINASGDVYVVDSGNDRVEEFMPVGNCG